MDYTITPEDAALFTQHMGGTAEIKDGGRYLVHEGYVWQAPVLAAFLAALRATEGTTQTTCGVGR